MNETTTADYDNLWSDDVLGRQPLAAFLTKSISEQFRVVVVEGSFGMTVALDADWGTGKSFFIKHWASELAELGHPGDCKLNCVTAL